jgi:multidrug efflux pump
VGTGVIGGMLASTFLAIIYVPVFFVVILRYFRVKPTKLASTTESEAGDPARLSAR